MSKLYLYTIYHANLSYSYIPQDLYPQIIERCYWPLIRIVEEQQIPLGLEFSGRTLQIINNLDRSFVQKLSELWQRDVCEVIGCGYVQSIMPLIPSKVNRENLRAGNDIYVELLGKRPSMAFVNEQVFSASLPALYSEAGYDSLVINWEGALPAHSDPENLYRPCAVPTEIGDDGGKMPVVWQSLEAYRNFQRYIENEINLDTFIEHLSGHFPATGERAFQLYGSDWEVFDFKPWLVFPDGFPHPEIGEMRKMSDLLKMLKQRQDLEIVTPSTIISHFPDQPLVHPESGPNPLPYKKQSQHSMTRWAVSGRDNVRLNSQCYQLYEKLLFIDWNLHHRRQDEQDSEALRELGEELWEELIFLWSSDFRTFTTEEKFEDFRNRMGAATTRAEEIVSSFKSNGDSLWVTNCSVVPIAGEPIHFTIPVNGTATNYPGTICLESSGLTGYELTIDGQTSPCQITGRGPGYPNSGTIIAQAAPNLGPGQTVTATVRKAGFHRSQNVNNHLFDTQGHIIDTPAVRLELAPEFGGSIKSLAFPQISSDPMATGCVQSIVQPSLSPGGLISGQLEVMDRSGQAISCEQPVEMIYPEAQETLPVFVPVRCIIRTEKGAIWKTYRVYLHQPRVDLDIRFQWRDLVPKYFRLGHISLNPEGFHRPTLYYATTHGGDEVERFFLQGLSVAQDAPLGQDYTATGCLGATEGWVVLGDSSHGLGLVTRPSQLYSVPMVNYQERGQDFSLTLIHSLGEQDETSHILWRGHSTWSLSLFGGKQDIIDRTRASALLINGGLVVQS